MKEAGPARPDENGGHSQGPIATARSGDLIGPHHSVRGQHWIRVISRTEAATPPLDSVRAQVRLDWIVEQEEARLERRVDELRDRYSIVFTGPEGGR